MTSVYAAALEWLRVGCSIVPVADDGSKRPAIPWKQFQTTAAGQDEIDYWFDNITGDPDPVEYGLGIICGAVSGNLELLEFEGRAVDEGLPERYREALDDHGQAELWNTISTGYMEQTPSGGLHFLYRVDGPARGNTKLARRPGDKPNTVDVLIETRGAGGFVVVAPTSGTVHPTGKAWVTLLGSPATIPTISSEQRDTLYAVASLLDQMPAHEPENIPAFIPALPGSAPGTRPGDDYNERASWDDLLGARGWTRMWRLGAGYGWRRPGKTDRSISATTGTSADGADRLYVFSTSTEFDTERPYSKFAAYTHLEHGGDYTAAAKQLAADGYGKGPTIDAPPVAVGDIRPTRRLQAVPTPPVDGTAALAPEQPPARATQRYSDDGNAHALITLHGARIRYDTDRGRWLLWNGYRWQPEPANGGSVRELVKDAAKASTPDGDANAERHLRKWLGAAGVSNTLTSASTDPRITVRTDQLDADPWILNTPGGLVDLRTGHIRPATPDDNVTRITSVPPEQGDPPAVWTDFLRTTFGGDQALAGYVQRLVGLALLGQVREQVLPFWFGVGANGKSTLTEVLLWMLRTGDDGYAIAAPSEMLMVRKHEPHSTELAQLAGRRLVVCSELEDGQRLAEARVKLLTGRDPISARFLYGQPFTFYPSHTIILAGNHQPQTSVGGPALWRRLRCVPFAHVVPVEQRDPELPDKLQAAGGHILAWAIQGAVDYLAGGMREPEAVRAATAEYEADQDTVGRFVEERVHLAGRTPVADIRKAYEAFCAETGGVPVSAKRLSETLSGRWGIRSEKGSKGRRFFVGASIETGDEDNEQITEREWYR